MKKIPTLFKREFVDGKVAKVTNMVTPGCEEAFLHGRALEKYDGACCAIINGVFYKRYDCKRGKTPPVGAIPCSSPDPVTGHWPHWAPVRDVPADKWFMAALNNSVNAGTVRDTHYITFEAVGPHFNGNVYGLTEDTLVTHTLANEFNFPRTFDGVRSFLESAPIEGIVFWLNDEPVCKIKRSDFGFKWPVSPEEYEKFSQEEIR